jgi:hypothetical protein
MPVPEYIQPIRIRPRRSRFAAVIVWSVVLGIAAAAAWAAHAG